MHEVSIKTYPRDMTCVEALHAEAARYLKRNYEMIFSHFWNFGFENIPGREDIGIRIHVEEGDQKALLKAYHGVVVNSVFTLDTEEILRHAKNQIKSGFLMATLIHIDYIPWTPEQEVDDYFPFLITGIDEVERKIFCYDPHINRTVIPFSFEAILEGSRDCYLYSAVPIDETVLDWHSLMKQKMEAMLETGVFAGMSSLAENISLFLDYETEQKMKIDETENVFTRNIKKISRLRRVYIIFIDYLEHFHKATVMNGVREKMKYISSQWLVLWSMCLRYFLRKEVNHKRENIAAKLRSIIDLEKSLCNEILTKLEGKPALLRENPVVCSAMMKAGDITDFIYIDIKDYLNNEGFASSIDLSPKASLTERYQQFMLTDRLPRESIWNVNGKKFLFPFPVDGIYDNISCAHQMIKVKKGYYSTILFLGCGEWGHQSAEIRLYYSDKTVKSELFEYSDWSSDPPLFNEETAWTGNCAEKHNGKYALIPWFKAHLYVQAVSVDNNMEMESFLLPDCPNIHIFAISLGKNSNI